MLHARAGTAGKRRAGSRVVQALSLLYAGRRVLPRSSRSRSTIIRLSAYSAGPSLTYRARSRASGSLEWDRRPIRLRGNRRIERPLLFEYARSRRNARRANDGIFQTIRSRALRRRNAGAGQWLFPMPFATAQFMPCRLPGTAAPRISRLFPRAPPPALWSGSLCGGGVARVGTGKAAHRAKLGPLEKNASARELNQRFARLHA